MHLTEKVPKVPLKSFKRTKIIATIGPATDSYEMIYKLIDSGVNGVRLNFSHGTHEEHAPKIPWARKASEELGKPVAIIQDLQGPKVRLGDFEGMIPVEAGQMLKFQVGAEYEESGIIPMQYDLSKKIKPGERLYLYDGKVRTEVTEVKDGIVYAKAHNDGILIKRKGMNVPDTDFKGDILTEKDMKDIKFGATQDIDYVAISFVQRAGDVEMLRGILKDLGSDAKIIAKIETKSAIEPKNMEELVQAADAIMVARGDLAVETPLEAVPVVQRQLIGLCQKYAKPAIVATQMMLSMVDIPEPTRAEVSDVATAVFTGADCVMLSEETAMGKHPEQTVKTMKRVVRYAEQHPPFRTVYPIERAHDMQNAISSSVITLADNIDAKAIVAETKSGATAQQIAAQRPSEIIVAVTSEVRTAQQLALVYGVKSYVRPDDEMAAQKLTDWLRKNEVLHAQDVIVTVSGQYPGVVGTTDTIKVRVLE
ncbi:MAG TPA: pyruvate kinase [Candidatus Saccharimonadales bacterium]|nr:pyruvate kinase [Candidatus Saccharimonadales bacterium]